MRRLGVVGGIGPESTVVYYRSLIAAGRELLGGASPPLLVNSIDVRTVLRLSAENPVPGLRDYLLSGPKVDEFEVARDQDTGRDVEL